MSKRTLVGLAAILLVGMAAAAQGAAIEFKDGLFRVTGWQAIATPVKGWASVFDVYTGTGDVPPLLGSYSVESGSLVFRPQYPIAPGVQYRAVFHPPNGGAPVEAVFNGPPRETTPRTRVVQVYPSGDVWPSNQLRLYIYFSEPMSRGEAASHIHFLDEKGQVQTDLLLPGEELWDPQFRRLTMTFDPGRIKRGLTSNQTIGPPIVEGKKYTLLIDRNWQDARGVPLVAGFRKSFRGGPALRTPPDPKQWKVLAPKANTTDALIVDFPVPMNYALLQRMLQPTRDGASISGTVSVARQETQWRFTPQQPWKPGDYQLVVDTGIEDLAGNHVGQPFDLDTFERVTEHITTKTITLPFSVR